MEANLKKAYIQLHIAVFIFGFTAILGKLIQADHFTLVWHRMWLAALGFFLIPKFFRELKSTSLTSFIQLIGIGVLVAIHWITFYGSIKIGKSASLTLGCFGLTSTFTSLLEPIIYRKKFDAFELLLGLLALLGISIIAYYSPDDTKENGNYMLAILIGVFSAFVAALFSTINSRLTNKINTKVMTFGELTGGFLFLSALLLLQQQFHFFELLLPFSDFQLIPYTDTNNVFNSIYSDIFWIFLLAFVCTNLAFVLNLNAMKQVSAFTANLAINLEPVYGILLAAFILKEHQYLNFHFYLGTSIILFSVILHSLKKIYVSKYQSNNKRQA